MVHRQFGAVQPTIECAHRRPQLQPDRLDHGQHRRGLCAQIQRAMEFEICADIARSIVFGDLFGNGGIDRLHPVDQGKMGTGQGAQGELRLQQ